MERPNDVLTELPGRVVMEEELTERLGLLSETKRKHQSGARQSTISDEAGLALSGRTTFDAETYRAYITVPDYVFNANRVP